MAELIRTNLSAPPVSLDTSEPAVSTNKTTKALGQLATLGARGMQLYEKEHEAKMANQAMDDMVNDAVNPDLQMHEAAYARVTTHVKAMNDFNSLKKDIADGKYNEMPPEDFQKIMRENHAQVKEGIAKSKYSDHLASTYDKFWLENGATTTAGQAGMYRKNLEFKQNRNLLAEMSALAKTEGVTAEQIIAAGSHPDYSMVDEGKVIQNALMAGIDSGSIKILEDLNAKLHFSNDPARAGIYKTAIKGMEKLGRAQNKAVRAKVYDEFLRIASEGGLTLDIYNSRIKDNPEYQDDNGNDLFTEKEFVNLMWKGRNNMDNQRAQNAINQDVERRTLTGNESTTAVNAAYDHLHKKYDAENMNVGQKAVVMGKIAKASPVVMKHYQNLSEMWGNSDPLKSDGSINNQWKEDFYTLRAFKESAGDVAFWKHLDDESASVFRIASNAEKYSSPDQTQDERLQQAAIQADKMKQSRMSGQRLNIPVTDKDIVDKVDNAVSNMYKFMEYNPLFGLEKGDDEFDQGMKTVLARHAADLLNNGLATKDTLPEALEQLVNQRTKVIGGNIQDMQGHDATILFGGDPNKVLNKYAFAFGVDTDPDENRVIVDVNSMNVIIQSNDTQEARRTIPLRVLQRYSLGDSMTANYKGKKLTEEDTLSKYDRYAELADMQLKPTPSRIGGAGPKIIEPGHEKDAQLYDERREVEKFLHLQDDLNERFFIGYVDNKENHFDYDLAKVTPQEWGKMTKKQKTETRQISVAEWTAGNRTIQTALDNIEVDRTFNFPL